MEVSNSNPAISEKDNWEFPAILMAKCAFATGTIATFAAAFFSGLVLSGILAVPLTPVIVLGAVGLTVILASVIYLKLISGQSDSEKFIQDPLTQIQSSDHAISTSQIKSDEIGNKYANGKFGSFEEIKMRITSCPEYIYSENLSEEEQLRILTQSHVEVLPNLFLGSASETREHFDLVVFATTAEECGKNLTYKEKFELPLLPLENGRMDVGLISMQMCDQIYLQNSIRAIDAALSKNGKVLICCQQGKDRSALVMVAYFMRKFDVEAHVAVNYIKTLRPFITVDTVSELEGKKAPLWDFLTQEFITNFPLEINS